MNPIDIIILLCIIPFAISGLKSGFIRQIIGLLSLILGIWASYRFANIVSIWISHWIQATGPIINITAFAIIFLVTYILLALLSKVIEKMLKFAMLGWVNRLLGLVFSLLKCSLVVGLLIIGFDALNTNFELVDKSITSSSIFYGPIRDASQQVFPYIKDFLFS